MESLLPVVLVVHLLIALALIGLILLQRSEGGALGIGGSGAGGGNIFSARGVGSGLTRATAILAVAFFATSIALTLMATRSGPSRSVFENAPASQNQNEGGAGQDNSGGNLLPNLGQGTASEPAQTTAPQVPTNN
jgi:preprotein translocase subunit SecG